MSGTKLNKCNICQASTPADLRDGKCWYCWNKWCDDYILDADKPIIFICEDLVSEDQILSERNVKRRMDEIRESKIKKQNNFSTYPVHEKDDDIQ